MTTITEDYVSFETAKLLKDKGFDVNIINSWHIVASETCNFEDLEKLVCGDINEPEYSEDYYPMITIQMVMKWLREVHKINIEIHYNRFGEIYKYLIIYKPELLNDIRSLGVYYSYEEACEAAIKYCLEILI